MPKYVIERDIPNAGAMNADQLRTASQRSCEALSSLPRVQWLESFVTDDRLYCIYIAPDENTIREHARFSGLPANRISVVRAVLDPTTAEPRRAASGGAS
jgi:hypothetical protein